MRQDLITLASLETRHGSGITFRRARPRPVAPITNTRPDRYESSHRRADNQWCMQRPRSERSICVTSFFVAHVQVEAELGR